MGPRGRSPEIIRPQKAPLQQIFPQPRAFLRREPDRPRIRHQRDRTIEQRIVRETHDPGVGLPAVVTADRRPGQLREARHEIDLGVRVIGRPPDAHVLDPRALVHDPAERECPVGHHARGEPRWEPAFAESPLRLRVPRGQRQQETPHREPTRASVPEPGRESRDGPAGRLSPARPRAAARSRRLGRRLAPPTSMSRAPVRRTISGIPNASADLDQLAAVDRDPRACRPVRPRAPRAAALLTVTRASSAPVNAIRWSSHGTEPGAAMAGSTVEFEQRIARRRHASRLRLQPLGHGARPRFVWRITPVALRTVRQTTLRRVRETLEPRTDGLRRDRPGLSGSPRPSVSIAPPPRRPARPLATASGDEPSASPGGRPQGAVRRSGYAAVIGRHRASAAADAWESNPPRRAERRATGFEDQGTHRDPTAPIAMVAPYHRTS